MEPITAFIPAAGLGERLRPITDHIPKPLLPILGTPVIETVLHRISRLAPTAIAVNMHHRWEQIQTWAASSAYARLISLFHEEPILGTGGAIKNASSCLKESTFIVHNSDIVSDIDLSSLVESHLRSGNIATLAVHDNDKFNNVWIDRAGNLSYVAKQNSAADSTLCKIAFMGIAVYSSAFLDFLPSGSSSVIDAWLAAIRSGQTIGTLDFSGSSWTDIGTPHAYAFAVFDTLKRQGRIVYAHASTTCGNAELQGYIVVEQGSSINDNAFVSNSILLPGARVASGSRIELSILGARFHVSIDTACLPERTQALSIPLLEKFGSPGGRANSVCIGTGGSDRTFFRIPRGETTFVLMTCKDSDKDYERHLALSRFFRRHGVPVPELLGEDIPMKHALFEDLGDLSLYAWLACRRTTDHILNVYRKVLDILLMLHTSVTDHADDCMLLRERTFDWEHLRWESNYFMDNYIGNIMQIHTIDQKLLDDEFDRLARTVDAFDKVILHRDFQSQNIMIVRGNKPRIIDFQGARMGPAAYDVASLLWDPYSCLHDVVRDMLLSHYINRRKEIRTDFDELAFRETILPCRLQRHMQALGAYGYLSHVKGKNHFLRHIPQALAYLKQESAEAQSSYPALHRMLADIHEKTEH